MNQLTENGWALGSSIKGRQQLTKGIWRIIITRLGLNGAERFSVLKGQRLLGTFPDPGQALAAVDRAGGPEYRTLV